MRKAPKHKESSMFVLNGYRWTLIDLALAIAAIIGCAYLGLREIVNLGISLASIAGMTCVFGTLLFLLLSQLPIFGGPVGMGDPAQPLAPLTQEQYRSQLGINLFARIPRSSMRLFLLFFVISAALTVIGALIH